MYKFYLNKLSDKQQGIVTAVIGGILLLYSLNIFQRWLNVFVFLFAILLIVAGAHRAGVFTVILPKNNRHK